MIGETILARTSAQCKQAYNWGDNISLIIGLQSASWWSVNIYCANYWPTIGAPIIVPPILAQLSAVLLNSANPTWEDDFAQEWEGSISPHIVRGSGRPYHNWEHRPIHNTDPNFFRCIRVLRMGLYLYNCILLILRFKKQKILIASGFDS